MKRKEFIKIGFFGIYRFCEQNLEDKYRPFAPAICFEMARDIYGRSTLEYNASVLAQRGMVRYLSMFYEKKDAFAALERKAYFKIVERIGYKAWLELHTQKSNP